MPVAESELVTGYLTEYSGLRFLLFFIGEFATAGIFSALAATLFLGGWYVPGIDPTSDLFNVIGPAILLGKVILVAFPDLLVPVHLPPLPRGSAAAAGLEGPDSHCRWPTSC